MMPSAPTPAAGPGKFIESGNKLGNSGPYFFTASGDEGGFYELSKWLNSYKLLNPKNARKGIKPLGGAIVGNIRIIFEILGAQAKARDSRGV
jgi:hypothetical protein